ncbi:MAG: hypothetical protein KBC34_01030 [Phenylobacterium sp.]|nr:hypothetical protein [Phenylobacterium sp.]
MRRSSRPQGEAAGFYRALSRNERDHIVRVSVQYAEAHREKGVAPLTPSTIHVLRVMLYDLMDWSTGALDDAYEYIALKARRSYQTVVTAIGQLERQGVLEKLRRVRPAEDPDGPRWVQDTNAYRFGLPAAYQRWWSERKAAKEARRRAREVPDDHAVAEQAAEAANAAHDADFETQRAAEARAAWRDRQRTRDVRGPGAAAYRAKFTDTA